MAQRMVLHVGSMKSGTSHLQSLMMGNRELLAERGLLLPGRQWRDQVGGVAQVLGRSRVASPPGEGAWQGLVDEVAAWPGTGLISMEFLGPAGPRKIERVLGSFPAGTVEVVITARDLNRQVPAMWQESLKNGRSFGFDEYVAGVRASEGPGKAFWREQAVGAMCRRWSQGVGLDRLQLVTLPHPGAPRGELWRRFSEAIGVDGSGIVLPETANESLGAASAEVLRRLNKLVDDLDYGEYAPAVKHRLAKKTLAARRGVEDPVGFDVPPWLPGMSTRMVSTIEDLGVRVVGDLADLVPVAVEGVHPETVPVEEQLEAALAGLEGLVRAWARRSG